MKSSAHPTASTISTNRTTPSTKVLLSSQNTNELESIPRPKSSRHAA